MKAMIMALVGLLLATGAQAASKSFQDWTTTACRGLGGDEWPTLFRSRPK